MKMIKRFLSPSARENYSDVRKYITERVPRLYNQIIGRDLRYFPQIWLHKEHVGSRYDGKQVYVDRITPESIVYSFGIGRDISFDLTMIEKFGVNIYAFDPTPVSREWLRTQVLPQKFHFFDFGIADYDGYADFFPFFGGDSSGHDFTVLNPAEMHEEMITCPVYRLKTILNMLGHPKIDILKIDIEGSEYGVIKDIISSKIDVTQLLVEFHHRFKNVGLQATNQAIKELNENGYKIFSIGADGQEYSFLRI